MSTETRDTPRISKPLQIAVTETPKDVTNRTGKSRNLGSSFSPAGASMSNTARMQAILRNRVRRASHLPDTSCQQASESGKNRSPCRIAPSTRSENPILGILHGAIQFPVLQEPLRIVHVRRRLYGLIITCCPIRSTW